MTIFQRIRTPFTEPAVADQARSQPRMRVVGDLLQERREDLGLDLEEIGAMLRIKPAYLAALEQGRTRDLPGAAYAIGFLRAYADFLGLNAEQVLTQFKAEASGVTARPDLALPVPLDERSLPGRALVLVALILALCGYGIWYYLSTDDRNRPEHVVAVPAALQTPAPPVLVAPPAPSLPTASAPAPNPPATAASAPVTAPAPVPAPLPPKQVTAAANAMPTPPPVVQKPPPAAAAQPSPAPPIVAQKPPPAAVPQPAVAPPAPSQTLPPPAVPAATTVAAGAGRISIRALADCWIQIRSADQSIVFSRVLKSGEVYNVPVRPGLSLRTGNAGVLEIAVDGKPAPSIGGIGTLRRDVALDPAELTAGHAVHG